MPVGSWDYEPQEMAVDYVTCELALETARTCRDLLAAVERIEISIARRRELVDTVDMADGEDNRGSREEEIICREMRRIELFVRLVPAILDPRRIVCLGDRAADNPDWWKANRIHFFCPELTHRQIGELTGLKPAAVRDYIHAAEIPAECYENLPEIE